MKICQTGSQLKNYTNELLDNFKIEKHYIWGVDFADMQLISKFNKGICFSLCVVDIFSKYAWVIPLKHKNGTSIINAFLKNIR